MQLPRAQLFRLVRRSALTLVALGAIASCARTDSRANLRSSTSDAQRAAIADTLKRMITSAYDLTRKDDAVARLMSLYPDSGVIVSASGGQLTTSRAELEAGIRAFWDNVGRNMRDPRWTWDDMRVEVLGPDAATVTATYRVPHLTPAGQPHVIAGAWTAVFERRGVRWVIVQEHLSDLPQAMPTSPSSAAEPHSMPGMSEPVPPAPHH
ncbi:MAG: nuclear transport factor 2 family protein [Gemmatimonadaceae bacterium]